MKILLFRNKLRTYVEYPPRIKPRRKRRLGLAFLVFLLIFTVLLNALSFNESLFDMVPRLGSLARWGKIETVADTFGNGSLPEFYLRSENKVSRLERKLEPKASASILDYAGHEVLDIRPEITNEGDGFKVTLQNVSGVKPGKYTLSAKWTDTTGANYVSNTDFRWGILAINTNKSIYLPGEEAKLGFGVLSDQGKAVCDAILRLEIEAQDGKRTTLSTDEGTIKAGGDCSPQAITNVANYVAQFKTTIAGTYRLSLKYKTEEGERSTQSSFEVRDSVPFDIERTSYPTRIYQPSPYEVKLTVVANQDFRGQITETLPVGFSPTGYSATTVEGRQPVVGFTEVGYQKLLTWTVDWKKGEKHELTYTIKAPDITPQFYLIKPLEFKSGDVFAESTNAGFLVQVPYGTTREFVLPRDGLEGTQEVHVIITNVGRFRWKTAVEYELRDESGKLLGSDVLITEVREGETEDDIFEFLKGYLQQRSAVWLMSGGKYTLREMSFDRLTAAHFQKEDNGDDVADHKVARLARKHVLDSLNQKELPTYSLSYQEANQLSYSFNLQNEKIGAGTEILRPNGAGDLTNVPGQSPGSTYHWDKVDEASADDYTTIVYSGADSSGQYDYYALADTALTTETVNSIDVMSRDIVTDGGGNGGYAQAGVRLSATDTLGTQRTSAAWVSYTDSALSRPGGGSWSVSDLNGLQAAIQLKSGSYYDGKGWNYYTSYLTQIYITVNYSTGGEPVPEYSLVLAPFAFGLPKIIRSIQQGILVEDIRKLLHCSIVSLLRRKLRRIVSLLYRYIVKLLRTVRRKRRRNGG